MIFQRILAWICTLFLMIGGSFIGVNRFDTISKYKKAVQSIDLYENTMEEALPQTIVHDLIENHFNSPLPEGKSAKKAIVIGYDGCRADALSLIRKAEDSAILTLKENGGHVMLTYCGGVNYPTFNKQATSTAPGWCSMLTGVWADVHGVTDNGIPKSNDHLTLLTTLVQDNIIHNSAFYVSWGGHFGKKNTTYQPEKEYVEQNGIAANFCMAKDDAETVSNVTTDLAKADCTDFIFTILEHCDHAGHSTGFGPGNKNYVEEYYNAELDAMSILKAVESRDTYESEDWLILITPDHGGYNLTHGMCTIQERMTFLVSNKPIG